MFAMFAQFFTMLTVLFGAGEKGARAIDHLATWAEETSGAFSDEARINRRAKMKALREKTGVTEAEVSTLEAPAVATAQ